MQEHPPQDSGGYWRSLKKEEDSKGFTLVELIVVIVILAILAAILIPGLLKWIDQAKDKKYELEARDIMQATEAAYAKLKAEGVEVTEHQIPGDISEHPWADGYMMDEFWCEDAGLVEPQYLSDAYPDYLKNALKNFTGADVKYSALWGAWDGASNKNESFNNERPWDGNVSAAWIAFVASDGAFIEAKYHANYGWKIDIGPDEDIGNWDF